MNKEKAIKNWDVVTMPVNPQNPNVTDGTSLDQILAIDAKSSNIEAAWKFISYVNGDDYARVRSKTKLGSSPVRTKYFTDEEGHHLQTFWHNNRSFDTFGRIIVDEMELLFI
ncbi:hypothetical protein [Cohnella silvisoli]|uniref:hypothetical protein n=1 Tax=Cohnella silvisoli TaxID=2873699 RepID=UPI001E426D9C|nr:hypothetical protein [Cohnella silvisoli]